MKAMSCWSLSAVMLTVWVIFDPAAGAAGLAISCALVAAEQRYRRRAASGATVASDVRLGARTSNFETGTPLAA